MHRYTAYTFTFAYAHKNSTHIQVCMHTLHTRIHSYTHMCSYEDNDQEVIPLWAPNQLVRIHNTPNEWPAEAERISR